MITVLTIKKIIAVKVICGELLPKQYVISQQTEIYYIV